MVPGEPGQAAPKPNCLTRAPGNEELDLFSLHQTWRNQYVPGTNPSDPLIGSAPLRAAALGIAHDIAEGELSGSALTADVLAERAIECGYPAELAVGGRGVATGKNLTPEQALMVMTSESWGAGIRVPAWVGNQPMKCIGVAHVASATNEAWVILIMAGSAGTCPQGLSSAVEPFDGGTPTATPTPPFVRPSATPTKTPSATPTATPTKAGTKVFMGVARD